MKERIDWERYEEDLRKELRNERIWEMGANDERNPHTSNILFIEDQLDHISKQEYGEVVTMVTEMYGEEYFSDYLTD